jgi:condensin complex subunit 2
VKNTWSLRLIDYIGQLTDQAEKEEKKTNFQKVTATLDASVKIYSSRVDSVHTDTYKMLGVLFLFCHFLEFP